MSSDNDDQFKSNGIWLKPLVGCVFIINVENFSVCCIDFVSLNLFPFYKRKYRIIIIINTALSIVKSETGKCRFWLLFSHLISFYFAIILWCYNVAIVAFALFPHSKHMRDLFDEKFKFFYKLKKVVKYRSKIESQTSNGWSWFVFSFVFFSPIFKFLFFFVSNSLQNNE